MIQIGRRERPPLFHIMMHIGSSYYDARREERKASFSSYYDAQKEQRKVSARPYYNAHKEGRQASLRILL